MVFLSHRALQGSRGQRLAIGVMLFFVWGLLAVVLTVQAVAGRETGWLPRLGFGAAAVSSYPLLWWSARYWWAAFCQGRRAEEVAEPDPWPWGLPPIALGVILAVAGLRTLARGDDAGWFSVGVALVLGVPPLVLTAVRVATGVSGRLRRTEPVPPEEPPRPQRNWGPIGR